MRQPDVDPHELREKGRVDGQDLVHPRRPVRHDENEVEHCGEHDGDDGPRNRDQQLLLRLVGHALESSHTADREEDDVLGVDAESARGERVSVLVQHDGREHRQDEQHAGDRRRRPALLIAHQGDPRQQEEKGGVDIDVDPRHARELPRPLHGGVPQSSGCTSVGRRRSPPAAPQQQPTVRVWAAPP